MASFFLLVLLLAMAAPSSAGTWCICKEGMGDSSLQKTLDYACGAGADCTPIHSSGACYNPNTVKGHCNYAVNNFFQRKAQATGTCDFAGTATIVTSDPSTQGCTYPSSVSAANTVMPTSTNGKSPYTNGVMGPGIGTNSDFNNDISGGTMLQSTSKQMLVSSFLIGWGMIMLLWG
ncbi:PLASMODESMATA CALLOSE-BINDING PROTEIN 3-like [Impatiens glandulifera]|uniref:PLASMODESMATA CALLOSE-BINDING PROTEIN 3-like n=1 Tax=Impatiens glandulifera TaxID=253017 RepID=UPI001FB0ABEE|nr:PLASMODESMATA CALLOSE-BINDING PROTEIN 3-like [Impatiens glandulifera]